MNLVDDQLLDMTDEQLLVAFLEDLDEFERTDYFPKGFNVFKAAGLERHEIRHSSFLSFLLDPNEAHGLDDEFLRKLLLKAVQKSPATGLSQLEIALSELTDLAIRCEEMRIDILGWSESNKLLFAIENKVGAKEGKDQLSRYRGKLENDERFKGYRKCLIYLTPCGEEGSDDRWVPISWKDVAEILKAVIDVKQNVLAQDAVFVINQYLDLIRRYIVADEGLISECRRLYSKHRAAIDLILRHGQVSTNFSSAVEIFLDAHPDLAAIRVSPSAVAFLPKELFDLVPDLEGTDFWGGKKPFVFWFSKNPGKISLILEVGPINDPRFNRNQLVADLRINFDSRKQKKIAPNYSRVLRKDMPIDKDEEPDTEQILDRMNKLYEDITPNIENLKLILQTFFESKLA